MFNSKVQAQKELVYSISLDFDSRKSRFECSSMHGLFDMSTPQLMFHEQKKEKAKMHWDSAAATFVDRVVLLKSWKKMLLARYTVAMW